VTTHGRNGGGGKVENWSAKGSKLEQRTCSRSGMDREEIVERDKGKKENGSFRTVTNGKTKRNAKGDGG